MQKNKNLIRLCVAGTPSSGKTFLIHALSKLLIGSDLTKEFPYFLRALKGTRIRTIAMVKQDIKTNILNPGKGTFHTKGNPLPNNPAIFENLYEYEYHNELVRKNPGFLSRLFRRTAEDNILLQIRNIPGEMFDTYFKYRGPDVQETIDELFSSFRNQVENASELIESYKGAEVLEVDALIQFRRAFINFCKGEGRDTLLGDINLIEDNFFSYLFYITSTDVILCHDISLSTSDPAYDKQENFLGVFNPQFHYEDGQKNLYYAFTKVDRDIISPEQNYVPISIQSLSDYWDVCSQLLKKVYSEDPTISRGLIEKIDNLVERNFIPNIELDGYPKPILKNTFFICTNYSNGRDSRGFLPFAGTSTAPIQDDIAKVWNENNYFNESYPLGVLELLMSLLHRFCECGKQGLGEFSHYDIIKHAFI